ncbi:hypothetical protein KSK55_13015 [Methanospirillum purgamenti]|uniref:Uncharacterized protein n=1 Tax=Methanospirillum hungatei TaxID=2203 RepID=A0A8F5ZHU3_METHU|nr:hypothetical protein KSK55_13015 [Methanospirillum hungatei]
MNRFGVLDNQDIELTGLLFVSSKRSSDNNLPVTNYPVTYPIILSDHLLITNPGWFPEGVTPDNLLIHEPKPRNPRLAEIFQEVNREGVGKGTSYVWKGS